MIQQTMEETFKLQQIKLTLKRSFIDLVTAQGYRNYEPEIFESYDSFIKVNQRIDNLSMVKILDNLGNILVLRPDVTTSIINQLIPQFRNGQALKLFYDTDIFTQTSQGTISKSAQFGVEYLGSSDNYTDGEVVGLMLKLFEPFDVDYEVEIGNQKFLNALFDRLKLPEDQMKNLKEIITYKNTSKMQQFCSQATINTVDKTILENLFTLEGNLDSIAEKLHSLPLDPLMKEALIELKNLETSLKSNPLKNRITFDLSMLSRFDYYQGITFQGFSPESNKAIVKGGRYNPINKTTQNRIPAVGFTIDIDALVKAVTPRG